MSTSAVRLELGRARTSGPETTPSSSDECTALLAAIDCLVVKVLDERIRAWITATDGLSEAHPNQELELSDLTIHQLRSVIDALTRREAARRGHLNSPAEKR
jgi:hypothetical protein